MAQAQSEIRYLTPLSVDVKKKNIVVSKEAESSILTIRIPNSLKSSLTNKEKFFLVALPEHL